MTSKPISDLDDLFGESIQAGRATGVFKTVKNATPEAKKPIATSEFYTLPEYWTKGRIIALIHQESKTLLGNYQEFCHKKEKGARRLERLDEPALVTSQEFVTGPWWLGDHREVIAAPERWESAREIILSDLFLSKMGVHAAMVSLRVCFKFGGMARVELLDHTTFHSPEANIVLTIPAGTNVLECLGLEQKIEIRKELQ